MTERRDPDKRNYQGKAKQGKQKESNHLRSGVAHVYCRTQVSRHKERSCESYIAAETPEGFETNTLTCLFPKKLAKLDTVRRPSQWRSENGIGKVTVRVKGTVQ